MRKQISDVLKNHCDKSNNNVQENLTEGGINMIMDELLTGESQNIEYKQELPSKSEKFMKTVVAFANGSGGKLVFGVEDDARKVVGIPQENIFKIMDAITNSISDSCVPVITPQITMQTAEDKTIIVVQVFPGGQRPYYIKSMGKEQGTYVRIAGTTRPADEYILKELEFEGSNRCFDQTYAAPSEPVTDVEVKMLCDNMYQYALKYCKNDAEKDLVKPLSKNILLQWGLLVKREDAFYPTNAFLLLTSNLFPQAIIQCGYFKGNTRTVFVDRRELTGSVQEQLEEAYQYVLKNIHLAAKIDGLHRQDVYELPPACIREMICNAVCHRSYLSMANIQVAIYDDRLEVTSPGTLPGGLTISDLKQGMSYPRNRGLVNAFTYMKIIEHWGSGIPKMFQICKEENVREPELIEMGSAFRVNLYRQVQNQGSKTSLETNLKTSLETDLKQNLSKSEQTVVKILRKNPKITTRELSSVMGLSLSGARYVLDTLKDKGVLQRVGSTKAGIWKIIQK